MKHHPLFAVVLALFLLFVQPAQAGNPVRQPQLQNRSQTPTVTNRPGGTAAGGLQPARPSTFPVIQAVNPAALTQGQEGMLTLTGQHLHHNMRVTLGAGITTGNPTILNEAASLATVSFQVATDAPAGARTVQVQYNNQTHQSPARINVVAVQARPHIRSITPSRLSRGQSYTLTLAGAHLEGVTAIDFGAGITVAAPVAEGGRLQVRIDVAADAAPGPRQVTLSNAGGNTPAAVPVMVIASPALTVTGQTPAAPLWKKTAPEQTAAAPTRTNLSVAALTPNQWVQGKTYNVNVTGTQFKDGLAVDLGDGITVEDLAVVSPTRITMQVAVSSGASAGLRPLNLRADASQAWHPFPAKAWVLAKNTLAVAKPTPKLIPPDLKGMLRGRITLVSPEDTLTSNQFTTALNEQTLFSWREENPGLAEWYEFRIVTENGFVIDKKRIDPVQLEFNGQLISAPTNSFQMDTAYFLKLLTEDWRTHANGVTHGLSNLYIWWEVAGYRTYTTVKTETIPGSSPADTAKVHKTVESEDVEVEISDRWSLLTPHKPTGLACGGSAATASAIAITNPDKGNRVANYPNDQWELTGKINLRSIPYATHINAQISAGGHIATYVPNLFLDWGDGSGAIPLEIDLSQPGYQELRPLGRVYHHRYPYSGNYTVRIYALPEEDIQQGAPDALAAVYDEVMNNAQSAVDTATASDSGYHPYFKIIKGIQTAQGPGFRFSGPNDRQFHLDENSWFAKAGRAYLIHCETKKIAVREDLVAQGPLHLESIAITGHNGSGSTGAGQLPTKKSAPKGLPKKNKTIPKPQSDTGPAGSTASPAAGLALTPSLPEIGQAVQGTLSTLVDAEISSCGLLQGNAGLSYYGEGRAKITWSLSQGDTRMVIGSLEEDLASPPRTEGGMVLTENTQSTPTPESFATAALPSPVVEMNDAMINQAYSLVVEAEVLPELLPLDQAAFVRLLASTGRPSLSSGDRGMAHKVLSWLVPEARAAAAGPAGNPQIALFQKSGLKLGVLAPSKEGISGRPVTASLNQLTEARRFPEIAFKKEKPYYVQSDPFRYRVKASAPDKPCRFLFPTSTGDTFAIGNLDVVNTGGQFTGSGVLDMHLYTGAGGSAERFILPVTIGGWRVADDGLRVTAGSLDLSLTYSISGAGMRLQLQKLAARAGQTPMNLTLAAKPADTDLHRTGTPQAPEWIITAPLSQAGDWYGRDTGGMEVEIGNSGFSIAPREVIFDLSAQDGMAANPGGAGPEWAGLHFGEDALLVPNLFDFQAPDANKGHVSDWGVVGTRLVGKTELTAPFSTAYKKGAISIAAISVDTTQSSLATYRNMDVHLPWLDAHLQGDAHLIYGAPGQEAYFDFADITQSEVHKEYRAFSMTARNLLFGNFPQTGWAARSESTLFRFEAEEVVFADNVVVPGIIYSMDGRPVLENGTSIEIPLGGQSTLGLTPVDLVSVRIGCYGSGADLLGFDFATTFSISEVLSAVEVPVTYGLRQDGNSYEGSGPHVDPFDLEVAFPAGQPRVTATVHIAYTGAGMSAETADTSPGGGWSFGVAQAYAAAGPQDRFAGMVDMAMFNGPPVQAEFRLGYMGGHDYWLMRSTLDLGPAGMPFAPPFLKLYQMRGGLGHNFPLDAFKSTTPITAVAPVADSSYLFMAGMRVGSSDGFVCTMDGDLSVKPGEGARMDFRAWLLDAQHAGNGNFQGYFQYAAGGFDGALAGHFSLLNDKIYFDIPENACTLHFGGSQPWHIYVGQEAGPKVRMHLLIRDADGYMMLDEDALRLGGGVYYYLGASIGHISGELKTGLTITSQPHVAGYGEGGVRAEVCYKKCISAGISVRVDISALPVAASARGCVTIPIPFWNPEICRTFSL